MENEVGGIGPAAGACHKRNRAFSDGSLAISDRLATSAFMMARCDGGAQYYQVIDLLLDQQPAWALVKKTKSPVEAMAQALQPIGFSKEKFDLCLRDGDTYAGINATKNRGSNLFKVETTPTFFINNERYVGEMTIEHIETIINYVAN